MRVALLIAAVAACAAAQARRAPVVIVPGLSGAAMEGKDAAKAKWDRYWVNIHDDTLYLNWTLGRLKLEWDPKTDTYRNVSGIDIRPIAFGTTDGLDYLDKDWFGMGVFGTEYMQTFIKALEKRGYRRNYDIVGAPYDWRLPLSGLEQTGYFAALEGLIEGLRERTGERVVVFSHCYGAFVMSGWWSRHGDQRWKDRNVKALVTATTPFYGASLAAGMLASGFADGYELWGHALLDQKVMRSWARTIGAIPLLLPKREFGGEGHVLVRTPKREYTLGQLDELLTDAGAELSREQLRAIRARGDFELPRHPGVRVLCVVVTGANTTTSYAFSDAQRPFDGIPRPSGWEDGDGTVTTRSASHCLEWKSQRPDLQFELSEWLGVGHVNLVKDLKFIDALYNGVLTD
eukprot:m51a1_g9146 putative group xv phospholipase a2-like (403) ;mRNA; r:91150-92694